MIVNTIHCAACVQKVELKTCVNIGGHDSHAILQGLIFVIVL